MSLRTIEWLFAVGVFTAVPITLAVADQVEQVAVNGQIRSFLLHAPLSTARPLPLLLAFHGAGGTSVKFAHETGFDQLADQRGFIVVYPQGVKEHWNAALAASEPDDLAFTSAIVQAVQKEFLISKLYAAGFSNGGMFTNSLACSNKINLSAIAAVAGFITRTVTSACTSARPLSVLEIAAHGDPVMPYGGGNVFVLRAPGNFVMSYGQTLSFWAKLDGCGEPDISFNMNELVNHAAAVACGGNMSVQGVAVKSGIHSWAGRNLPYPINTSQEVVTFLLSH